MPHSEKPIVKDSILTIDKTSIPVGSPLWYEWLLEAKRFSFKGTEGCFVAQCEVRRNKAYWYAYRRRSGKLLKAYLGKAEELTLEKLQQTGLSFTGQTLVKQRNIQPAGNEDQTNESRIDTSFLPITKINVPVLPRQLVSRIRLNEQINTPLTLIYAPSGFGKSTLINDWKQACGYPVAWLTLDEHDNHLMRFWYSVVTAFQTIHPDFGEDLLTYLGTGAAVDHTEAVLLLINETIRFQELFPRLGLVLDDFHRINAAEIYDSIQVWLENFPTNMQLVISGHTRPPLSLGHLRARGMLTELDANDLRFTIPEAIDYLRQYPQDPPLAHDDLEKLVKHTEGWAAGLTLTALALGKQEDRRQFIDTFSGAHIYLREYFMEAVLHRSTPEVQMFLLKTAILKNLNGSLCNAITGLNNGEEMLAHLWQENLFIVRLEEKGWYRYHDLFAEMLYSQLQSRFPEEVSQLHQRAAQWYRQQYTPADAIYHLLATEAWEEAAALVEEMALRELEQFGEDSRLLRWLQELPENVVQRHKKLLFVYLRLATVALPQNKIERFVAHIETSISSKSPALQTQEERDVLTEVRQIRRNWGEGNTFIPPSQIGSEYDARWNVLNRLHLLRQAHDPENAFLESEIIELLHVAQVQQNLFVTLMAAGALVRQAIINGQLRRSERLARQVLDQTLSKRGKLPEPASILLAALSQIHFERNEIELAQNYLEQVMEVDPNPASTNMLVQAAILRAKTQVAQGQVEEARATIRSVRNLHILRPSGLWTDQDLIAYEAFICLRIGDVDAAELLLRELDGNNEHHLSQWVQAQLFLKRQQFDMAEKKLVEIITKYPNGIIFEPLMEARVSLALALFGQHKMNQSLQVMTEAIRLAAPERFIRPFLESGMECVPLLSLMLETQNLTRDSQAFTHEILQLLGSLPNSRQILNAELEALSTAASITMREQDVLELMSAGFSNAEIARKLSISKSTVKTHLTNIYYKLGVNRRVQAITQAKELKLVH